MKMGFEETTLNIAMLWAVIVTLVAALGTYGLILGRRHCESTFFQIVSLGTPICVAITIATLFVWDQTGLQFVIFFLSLALVPTSCVIIACGFVASLVVSVWLSSETGTITG